MAVTRLNVLRDSAESDFECTVTCHAAFEAGLEAMGTLRETLGRDSVPQLPPRFLRHADEQTVVGMAAVLQAMAAFPTPRADFSDWGVLAAPCLLGRLNGAVVLRKFQEQGDAAVSPHVIPQHSLHSVSSAISVGLGMHGPNFGIGGGPEAIAEGLTVALSFLNGCMLPGLWLVLTQWDPEAIPDGKGGCRVDSVCQAVAVGLGGQATWGSTGSATMRLRLGIGRPPHRLAIHRGVLEENETRHRSALSQLADALSAMDAGNPAVRWLHPLPWGGCLELQLVARRQRKAA